MHRLLGGSPETDRSIMLTTRVSLSAISGKNSPNAVCDMFGLLSGANFTISPFSTYWQSSGQREKANAGFTNSEVLINGLLSIT